MADSCVIKRTGNTGQFNNSYQDSVQLLYEITLDPPEADPYNVWVRSQLAGPNSVPIRHESYAVHGGSYPYLTASNFNVYPVDGNLVVWQIQVSFTAPRPGASPSYEQIRNPLSRPWVFNIEYEDEEFAIEEGANREAIQNGAYNRPAMTWGPLTNCVGRRPEKFPMGHRRVPVYVLTKNYATLGEIEDLNNQYMNTTNQSAISMFGRTVDARKLQYLITDTSGYNEEDGQGYYTGTTRIRRGARNLQTTDVLVENTGIFYYIPDDKSFSNKIHDKKRNAWVSMTEPVPLRLETGYIKFKNELNQEFDTPDNLQYTYLKEADYSRFSN